MTRPIFAVATLTLALLTSCAGVPRAATSPPAPTVDALAWLVGHWSGPHDGARYDESWTRTSTGSLSGTSRLARDGSSEAIFTETLSIDRHGDTLVYTSLPSGQARAEFRATRVGDHMVVFENPTHDWPTRIAYVLQRDGWLQITVDGPGADGGARVLAFRLQRAL